MTAGCSGRAWGASPRQCDQRLALSAGRSAFLAVRAAPFAPALSAAAFGAAAAPAPVPVPVSNPRPVEVPNNEGGTDWVWPLLIVAGVVVAVICLPVEIPAAIGAAVMAGITWAIETGAAYVIASSAALATRFSPQALQMINAAAK